MTNVGMAEVMANETMITKVIPAPYRDSMVSVSYHVVGIDCHCLPVLHATAPTPTHHSLEFTREYNI